MAAAKSSPKKQSSAKRAASAATKGAAKGVAKGAAAGAKAASSKGIAAGGERIGRGTRWTEQQVSLMLETVQSSSTAKAGFEAVAEKLGKSAGTVQQKYYNLQRQSGEDSMRGRGGRPSGSGTARPRAAQLPTAAQLRAVDQDELIELASRVRDEVVRRREQLELTTRQFADLAG